MAFLAALGPVGSCTTSTERRGVRWGHRHARGRQSRRLACRCGVGHSHRWCACTSSTSSEGRPRRPASPGVLALGSRLSGALAWPRSPPRASAPAPWPGHTAQNLRRQYTLRDAMSSTLVRCARHVHAACSTPMGSRPLRVRQRFMRRRQASHSPVGPAIWRHDGSCHPLRGSRSEGTQASWWPS